MDINQIFNIILQVLKDIRVIGTVIVMILVISFAKFITTYKKKPNKRNKFISKAKTSKSVPQQNSISEKETQ